MAAAAATSVRRAVATLVSKSSSGATASSRQIHTTASRQAAAGGHEEDAYLHAYHMYDLPAMKNRKLKFGLGVSAVVVLGTAVPLIAVWHQQIRASG